MPALPNVSTMALTFVRHPLTMELGTVVTLQMHHAPEPPMEYVAKISHLQQQLP